MRVRSKTKLCQDVGMLSSRTRVLSDRLRPLRLLSKPEPLPKLREQEEEVSNVPTTSVRMAGAVPTAAAQATGAGVRRDGAASFVMKTTVHVQITDVRMAGVVQSARLEATGVAVREAGVASFVIKSPHAAERGRRPTCTTTAAAPAVPSGSTPATAPVARTAASPSGTT